MEKTKSPKKQKNRTKQLRNRNIRKGINRTYWLIVVGVIASISIMAFQVWSKYMDTLDWEKQDPSVTMASQSLDLLYDKDPLSRKSKIEFLALKDSMLTKNGMLTDKANKTNINELKSLLENINTKSSEVDYTKEYAEVALKYSLDIQYKELFVNQDGETFKTDVTPLTLAELNNSTFDDLNTLFKMNNDDSFVKDFISKEKRMASDVDTFNELVSMFNKSVIIKGDTLSLANGFHEDLESQFLFTKANLNFKWNSTSYMDRIVSLIAPMNDELIEDYADYAEYETDQANKKVAYDNWKTTQDEWFATVRAIREQALAEKAAREEAARVKLARDKAFKVAVEEIGLLKNISDEERNNYLTRLGNASTEEEVRSIVNDANERDKFIVDEEERKRIEEEKKKEEEEKKETDESTSDTSSPSDGTTESSSPSDPLNHQEQPQE